MKTGGRRTDCPCFVSRRGDSTAWCRITAEMFETNVGINGSDGLNIWVVVWQFRCHGIFGCLIVSLPNMIFENARPLLPQAGHACKHPSDLWSCFLESNLTRPGVIIQQQWLGHRWTFRGAIRDVFRVSIVRFRSRCLAKIRNICGVDRAKFQD